MSELPEDLLVALDVYQSDPEGIPPQGSPSLRAMNRMGGEPTPADFEWVENQKKLQEQAMELWVKLNEVEPVPTAEDVTNCEEVVFPDWIGTIWQRTILDPWAQNLGDAIEEAEAYIESKQATVSEA